MNPTKVEHKINPCRKELLIGPWFKAQLQFPCGVSPLFLFLCRLLIRRPPLVSLNNSWNKLRLEERKDGQLPCTLHQVLRYFQALAPTAEFHKLTFMIPEVV